LEAMSPMKGGVLRTHTSTPTRHAVALGAVVAMIALPLLLLGASTPSTASAGHSGAVRPASAAQGQQQRHLRRIMLVGNKVPAPTTTTTTAPAAPAPMPAPVVTTPPATAVRVAAPTPTTAAPAPTTTTRPMSSASGLATWYSWRAGQCASPSLPMGTTVVVRNVATGASVTCVVTDREASNPGRIIDLDTSVFSAIAPLSAGTVSVTVSW